ncbi:MAG: fused MFS/spermidine synthase [Pseudomonadota bacterium]
MNPTRLALVSLFFAGLSLIGPQASAQSDGELLESRESLYNNIYVYRQQDGLITMLFGKNRRFWTESAYDPNDARALPVRYTRYMTVALAYPETLGSVLEIGLGGGRTAAYLNLHMPELPITSVELDGEVIELAEEYFDVVPSDTLRLVEKDGRLYLAANRDTHDLILVDAYRGPFVPFHLLTKEFFEIARDRLSPGGILVQNIEPTTMLFEATVVTLKSVFDVVELFDARGNIVAIAYDGPERKGADLANRARALQQAHGFKYPLPTLLKDRRIVANLPEGEPLVDDFAPVEMLKAIERHNAGIDGLVEDPTQ